MQLIDVHGAVQQFFLSLLAAVSGVSPCIALQRTDAAGIFRQFLHTESIGVAFIDLFAIGLPNAVFIGIALFGIGGKGFPDAVFYPCHRQIFFVPEIPVSGDADAVRSRCPDAEHIARNPIPFCFMAAQIGICVQFIAVGKAF